MGRHLQLSLGTVDGKNFASRTGGRSPPWPHSFTASPSAPGFKVAILADVRRAKGRRFERKNFASPVPRLGHNIEDWGWSGGAGGSIEALASTMIQLSQWTWQARFGLAKYFSSPVWMSQRRPNSYVSPYVSSSQPRSGFAYRSPSQAWPPRRTPKHLG